MQLRSRSYILRGAIAGLFAGNVLTAMLYGNHHFVDISIRHLIVISACISLCAFLGHIMRHLPPDEIDKPSSET